MITDQILIQTSYFARFKAQRYRINKYGGIPAMQLIEDNQEISRIRANLAEWLSAFNAKDFDRLATLYHPDSLYCNAQAPMLRGIEQIRPWYEEAFKAIDGTLIYQEEAAIQEGALGMLVGAYYFQPPEGVTPPADAQLTGRVSLLYRRNEVGDWKLIFDMDNAPPDVTPDVFCQS